MTQKKKIRDELWLVMQQGGSTTEWYARLFDYEAEALDFRGSCAEATYNTTEPIRVPTRLAKALLAHRTIEQNFVDLVTTAVKAAVEIA